MKKNDVLITQYGYDKKTLPFSRDIREAYYYQYGWQRCHGIHSPSVFECQGCDLDYTEVDELHYYEREGYNIDLCNDCAGKLIYPDVRMLRFPATLPTPGVSKECSYHKIRGDYIHDCNEHPAFFHESQNWICRKHLDEYCSDAGEVLYWSMRDSEYLIGDTSGNDNTLHDVEEVEREMCHAGYAPIEHVAEYHVRSIPEWKILHALGDIIKNVKESPNGTFADLVASMVSDHLAIESLEVNDDFFNDRECDPRMKKCLIHTATDEASSGLQGEDIIFNALRCALPDVLGSIIHYISEQVESSQEHVVKMYRRALEGSQLCDPCDCGANVHDVEEVD